MWLDERYSLLHHEITENLSALTCAAELKALARKTLGQYRVKTQAKTNQTRPWPLLPLLVCEAISGKYDRAIPAAAALYLLKISAEIFDDIEDADSRDSLAVKYGTAIAVNTATTFLMLAEREITRLTERAVNASTAVRVMDVINSTYINACGGQHLDLSRKASQPLAEKRYLDVTAIKSASITRCACHTGALLATTNATLIKSFISFGHNLGMASQIANDILGIIQGKDIVSPKITLPVIFALNQGDGKTRSRLKKIFVDKAKTGYDAEKIKDLLFQCGAMQYTTIKMEYYKQQATTILLKIEDRLRDAEKLKIFLA
jgi:geranylgeranyl diphosphate synthase type I